MAETGDFQRSAIYRKSEIRLASVLEKVFIAKSQAMKTILEQVEGLAPSDSTVLISGETGTGKEVLARYCHKVSRRAQGPFVAVNCAALPEELLESELFGHRKGSFTGAYQDHEGLMVRANGGTLFLDEIGDMSLRIQAKLLRVVQERTVRPVGGCEEVPIDIRIVCASHQNLLEAVSMGEFRQDLYFRLSVLPIHVPPLRSRPEDILALAKHFVSQFGASQKSPPKRLTPEAEKKLLAHNWPGNVRELSNIIERALVYSKDYWILASDIRFDFESLANHAREELLDGDLPDVLDLKMVEKEVIAKALRASNGVKSLAAKKLGIDRKTLLRKEKEYGLSRH